MREPCTTFTSSRLDYDPFGMGMVGRSWEVGSVCRYGFNGMESEDEINGNNNLYTTEYREYDCRIGRWLSIDPFTRAFESPYVTFHNNPIYFSDPRGDDPPKEVGRANISNFIQRVGIAIANVFKSDDDAFIPKRDYEVTFNKENVVLDTDNNKPRGAVKYHTGSGVDEEYTTDENDAVFAPTDEMRTVQFNTNSEYTRGFEIIRKNIFGKDKVIYASTDDGAYNSPVFQANRFLIPKKNEKFYFSVKYGFKPTTPTIEVIDGVTIISDFSAKPPRLLSYKTTSVVRTTPKDIINKQKMEKLNEVFC